MPANSYLLFPLASAVMYAFAAVSLKRAERLGVGALRITVASNFALAAAFTPFYPWPDFPHFAPAVWWPVCAAGATFAVGQLLTILAFAKGEVSVATTALGTKAFFVAVVSAAFTATRVAGATWAAAALMAAGLWILIGRPRHAERQQVTIAVACSLGAAFAYACFDTIVGTWGPTLSFGRLVPAAVLAGSVLSLPLLWTRSESDGPVFTPPPEGAVPPIVIGLTLMSIQSLFLIGTIGRTGDATHANIVYASRGIWSVVLVQGLASTAAASGETFHSRADFVRRLCGASVMLAGVVLAFTR